MINEYVPRRTYAIVAGYNDADISAVVAGAVIRDDNSVKLVFPKENPFVIGQKVTLHLDNRTGVESFTPDLRVYRSSYKGMISAFDGSGVIVRPLEYDLRYSNHQVEVFKDPGYAYPVENRPDVVVAETPLEKVFIENNDEHENKLGVWITRAMDQPHTTVMAFISSKNDDIFVIAHRGSFKDQNIRKDGRCCFAIDHRSTFVFEKAFEWNYTIIQGRAYTVPKASPLFETIQAKFIEKNPWEILFFSDPEIEMFHISPESILCPEKYRRR